MDKKEIPEDYEKKVNKIRDKNGYSGGSTFKRMIKQNGGEFGPYWYHVSPPSDGRKWTYLGPANESNNSNYKSYNNEFDKITDIKGVGNNTFEEIENIPIITDINDIDGFRELIKSNPYMISRKYINDIFDTLNVSPEEMKDEVLMYRNGWEYKKNDKYGHKDLPSEIKITNFRGNYNIRLELGRQEFIHLGNFDDEKNTKKDIDKFLNDFVKNSHEYLDSSGNEFIRESLQEINDRNIQRNTESTKEILKNQIKEKANDRTGVDIL